MVIMLDALVVVVVTGPAFRSVTVPAVWTVRPVCDVSVYETLSD